jgi:hypothetical protein
MSVLNKDVLFHYNRQNCPNFIKFTAGFEAPEHRALVSPLGHHPDHSHPEILRSPETRPCPESTQRIGHEFSSGKAEDHRLWPGQSVI